MKTMSADSLDAYVKSNVAAEPNSIFGNLTKEP